MRPRPTRSPTAAVVYDPSRPDGAVTADSDALRSEFLEGYYGPAAEAIARYIDIIHESVRQDPSMRMGTYNWLNRRYIAPERIALAEAALRDAAAAVAGDAELASRVRHAHMPVWYVLAKRGPESRTWQAVEQAVGAIDIRELAEALKQVHEERGFTQIAEGDPHEHWLEWIGDYARQAADAPPRPAEAGENVAMVVQAGHLDARMRWLRPAEGASDGWAMMTDTHHWFVRHFLDGREEFNAGGEYRLMARVRGLGVADDATGTVASVGLHGQGAAHRADLDAATLRDEQWHVVEVARWRPEHSPGLWIALTREAHAASAIDALELDAFWLEPVGE